LLKFILIISALFISSVETQAWTRYGGDVSCGKLISQTDKKFFVWEARGWAFGYISGINELTEQTWKKPPDEDSIWLAVLNYCKDNPLDYLYEATVETYAEVMEKEAS
jgi:hypothetical protein